MVFFFISLGVKAVVLSGDRFSRSCETDDRHRKTGGSRSWPRKRPAGPEKNGQLSLNELEKKQNKKNPVLIQALLLTSAIECLFTGGASQQTR